MADANRIAHIVKRSGRIVTFDEARIADAIFKAARSLGGEDIDRARVLAGIVTKKLNDAFPPGKRPSVEEIQDFVVETLEQEGHQSTARSYQRYRQEHSRLRAERQFEPEHSTIPYKILWEVLVWNVDYGCDSINHLNDHVRRGTFPILVKEAETVYHREVDKLVEKLVQRLNDVRVVVVAGPSSSGKTTTTIKISERLAARGKRFRTLALDNYFKGLEHHPKDEFGDYDFERPEALDLDLINEHLAALVAGRQIAMPQFDFKTGSRTDKTVPLALADDEILLLDSLHGLYEPLTAAVPQEKKFKVYIEALSQIRDLGGEFVRWADVRLLRRMVRDSWHRSYGPQATVGHWHYVRRSELEYIVPYIHQADFIFNGSLPYELPVLKKYLWPFMDQIHASFADDPKRHDASIRARRVHRLLESVRAVEDDDVIPRNSLMREYIGGSEYEY